MSTYEATIARYAEYSAAAAAFAVAAPAPAAAPADLDEFFALFD